MKLIVGLVLLLSVHMVAGQDDPNCIIPASQGGCQVCATFYYILNGRCTPVNANCLGYNSTNGKCTTCMAGYKLNGNGQCNMASASGGNGMSGNSFGGSAVTSKQSQTFTSMTGSSGSGNSGSGFGGGQSSNFGNGGLDGFLQGFSDNGQFGGGFDSSSQGSSFGGFGGSSGGSGSSFGSSDTSGSNGGSSYYAQNDQLGSAGGDFSAGGGSGFGGASGLGGGAGFSSGSNSFTASGGSSSGQSGQSGQSMTTSSKTTSIKTTSQPTTVTTTFTTGTPTISTFSGQGTVGTFSSNDFEGQGGRKSSSSSLSGAVYITNSQNIAFSIDILNVLLQNIDKFNSDNPDLPSIVLVTGDGERLSFPVSQEYQGPIYFTVISGQALGAFALSYIQQTINTINSQYGAVIVFVSSSSNSNSSSTINTITSRQVLTQNQVYVTTSSGLPVSVSLLNALQKALDNYNRQNPQQPSVVMIYSNGQRLPTVFTAPINGPIYFSFANGQAPTSLVLEALQNIIKNINTVQTNTSSGTTSSTIQTTTTTVTEADRIAAEAAARRKANAEAAAQAAKRAAEQQAAAEQARKAQEQAAYEAQQLEEQRLARKKAQDEANKLAAQRKAAEDARIKAQQKAALEAKKLADQRAAQQKAEEEARRLAAQRETERLAAEEARRREQQQAAAEARARAQQRAAEAKRIADQKAAEAKRIADQKAAAEAKRISDQRAAQQKREERRRWIQQTSQSSITVILQQISQGALYYFDTSDGSMISADTINGLLQAINKYNDDNPDQQPIIIVTSNGQAILSNVTSPVQGPIYFTTVTGSSIMGSMLATIQQIITTYSSTEYVFQIGSTHTITTTTTTTTTYTFNPVITPEITSNNGQSFSAGFIRALIQAINNYNANQQQPDQIILIYSDGHLVDTSSISTTTFNGPIYFITYSGQQLSSSALTTLQQILSGLSQQWSVTFYSNSAETQAKLDDTARLEQAANSSVTVIRRQISSKTLVFVNTISGQPLSVDIINGLLDALRKYNSDNPNQQPIIMVTTSGQPIVRYVSNPMQGPIYFTTVSGAQIVGSMLISLQQIVASFNTGSTDFIFNNNSQSSTTTTTTTTTYTFNPTLTPYVTSNSGQSFSAGFIAALVQALNDYNANQQQSNRIVLIYSNGQVVDTSSTTGTTFFGPIYFITYAGQQVSQSALTAIQQIMTTLSQQWSVIFYSNSQSTTPTIVDGSDPNCIRYQGNTNVCVACSTRFYLSSRTNRCVAVSNQCNTFNTTNGQCLTCYKGYTLSNGDCYILVSKDSFDANCKTAGANGVCKECFQGYFYSSAQSKCVTSNPLCRTITASGTCQSCYPGYVLRNGSCFIEKATTAGNCKNFSNGVCNECANGYIKSNGKCFPVNPQCKTYSNNTGECLTCYPGYILSNGNCIIGGATPSGDSSCRTYDQSGKCQQCSERFYKSNGKCLQVSDFCNTYDNNTGKCLTCYRGYSLRDGECYKMLVQQEPAPVATAAQVDDSSQQVSQQQTVVTRQQGNADLQFGVITVPVDSGTVVTSNVPANSLIGALSSSTSGGFSGGSSSGGTVVTKNTKVTTVTTNQGGQQWGGNTGSNINQWGSVQSGQSGQSSDSQSSSSSSGSFGDSFGQDTKANCKTLDSSGICTQCNDNFLLFANTCIPM